MTLDRQIVFISAVYSFGLLLRSFHRTMLKCIRGKLMSKVTSFDSPSDEPIDYKAAVVQCIEKIDSLRQQMSEDQDEIDRLRIETREIIERLKAA